MSQAFDAQTYRTRLQRVRASMRDASLDGLVITLPHSIYWLTGFDTTGFAWVYVDLERDPLFVSRNTEEPGFRETSYFEDARFYDPDLDSPASVMAVVLTAHGQMRGVLGIDLASFGLLPMFWEELRAELTSAVFVDASDLMSELRYVKTPAEVELQMQAAQMADLALSAGLAALRPGVSETYIQGLIEQVLGEAGSEYASTPPMVTAGTRSAIVHGMAQSGRHVARGDVVSIEVGAAVRRYHAIVMRSAVVGRATKRLVEVARCQKEALAAASAQVMDGNATSTAARECARVLSAGGVADKMCHRLGYSLGIGYPPVWVEPMIISERSAHTFRTGMVFSMEPNLSLPDEGFGLKLGDTFICTDEGARSMSRLDHDLVVIA